MIKMQKHIFMPALISAALVVFLSGGYFLYALNAKDMKIRNACYAIGIKYMPPTTDQSLIQGSRQYQDCVKQGWNNAK